MDIITFRDNLRKMTSMSCCCILLLKFFFSGNCNHNPRFITLQPLYLRRYLILTIRYTDSSIAELI